MLSVGFFEYLDDFHYICMKGMQLEATLHLHLPIMHNTNKTPLLFSMVEEKLRLKYLVF